MLTLQYQIEELCNLVEGEHTYTCATYVEVTTKDGTTYQLHSWGVSNYLSKNSQKLLRITKQVRGW